MRTVFRRTPAAQWKVLVEGFAKAEGAAGEVSNWKVSDPASLKDPFKVEYDLSANRYADWSSSKTSIALPLARSTAVGSGEGDVEDDEPLDLGAAPTELSYRLRLQLAPGVSARPPLPVTVSRDYAEYRATYFLTGSTFVAERLATIRVAELPADRKQDYAAFTRVVTADARQVLALEIAKPIASSAVGDLKADELNRSGFAALQAGNYAEAITLLKRVVELEPKDKTAWNNLGRSYTALGNTSWQSKRSDSK